MHQDQQQNLQQDQHMAALAASKKALRQAVQQKIARLTPASIKQQSQNATNVLLSSSHYKDSKKIAVYLSMEGKEIETNAIVEDALSRGKVVFVPYIHAPKSTKSSDMHMFSLHSREDYLSLQPDKWGIPSLAASSIAERTNGFGGTGLSSNNDISAGGTLDLIVMPGVAFDSSLGRLGHGKGYYDRYLRRCHDVATTTSAPMPKLVALSLREQKCEKVPTGPDDWPIDALITGAPEVLVRQGGPW